MKLSRLILGTICLLKLLIFTSKKSSTLKAHFITPVFLIPLSPLCIQHSKGQWALGHTYGKYVSVNSTLLVWKMSRFYRHYVSQLWKGVFSKRIFFNIMQKHTDTSLVYTPLLRSYSDPVLRQESLVQSARSAADCECRWGESRWNPQRGSSGPGLHRPVCPDGPPFETNEE